MIMLDPGHGGADPGAVGRAGTKEKNITLAVSHIVKVILTARAGVELTRQSDIDISLDARCMAANKAGAVCFVSIHCNAGGPTSKGIEVYSSRGNTKADGLATKIITRMERELPEMTFRKDFSDGDPDKEAGFYVLKNTSMPAVLVELPFISNPEEEKLLNSVEFQVKVGRAIGNGILEFLGLDAVPPPLSLVVGGKDIPCEEKGGKVWGPVREIAEALGGKVGWDGELRRVTVD